MEKTVRIIRLVLAAVFFCAALAVACVTVQVCIHAEAADPVIEDTGPGSPTETLESFLACLKAGDYPGAYGYLSNYSTLGLEAEHTDPVSALFWEKMRSSWEFTVAEGHEMEGLLLTKRITVRSLDFKPVVPLVHDRVQQLLEQDVEEARLKSDVYNDDGSYKEELVRAAMDVAVREAVADVSPYYVTRELTVKLSYQGGRWLIAADQELISALTGGAVH